LGSSLIRELFPFQIKKDSMRKLLMVGTGVVPVPPKFGGGTEVFLYEICRFASGELDCTLLDRRWPGTPPEETREGVRFCRVRVPKVGNVFALRLTELLLGFRALLKAKKLKPHLIHLHTPFTALPFALLRFLLPQSRLIYTCHNPAWTVPDGELDPFNLLIEKVEGFVMRRMDKVTADSRTSRRWILRKLGLPPHKVVALYNFIDFERFSRAPRGLWKRKKGIKGPIVLYASKLTRAKGIDLFLKAAALVKRKFSEIKFVVVGPVTFEREAENPWVRLARELGISQDTLFTGAVDEEEFPLIFASADVFCLPTQRETFCITVAEAMAAGLPVVTSDLESLREVAGGAAMLVDREIPKIEEALSNLLTSESARIRLGKKAREKAKKYDRKRILKKYLKFYLQEN
jgi:glycosyltransferase involved in cell wall biosynthesis